MTMSLFSSFDALCAESFGQKVSLLWAPAPGVNTTTKDGKQQETPLVVLERKAGSIVGGNKGKEGSSSLPSSNAKKPQDYQSQAQQQKRRPRFAVELDGVHCFETIIPY